MFALNTSEDPTAEMLLLQELKQMMPRRLKQKNKVKKSQQKDYQDNQER
jgi:hypothetical protein